MDSLEKLKFNIREKEYPCFSEEELLYILNDECKGDVKKASYKCLIRKAENTGISVSGLTTKDSSSYFKMLASNFITTNSGLLGD